MQEMKGTFLAALLILVIGILSIKLAEARMDLEPEYSMGVSK